MPGRFPRWVGGLLLLAACGLAGQTAHAQQGPYVDNTIVAYGNASCTFPVQRTINVPEAFIIEDLDFEFVAEHGYRTDTNMWITSPSGTRVDLLSGNYGANLNNYIVRFDDDADVIVDQGTHNQNQVIGGPVVPVRSEADPLSDFIGEQAQGNWVISVCDVYRFADGGNINRLQLFFGGDPDLQAEKVMAIYDPDALNLYAVPGNDVIYTLSITNTGLGEADAGTIELIDALPAQVEFFNGDIDDDGAETSPVSFSHSASGLTFNYATDVRFSTAATRPADFNACSTVAPDSTYRSDFTFVCLNPKGAFASGTPAPTASFSFRARLK